MNPSGGLHRRFKAGNTHDEAIGMLWLPSDYEATGLAIGYTGDAVAVQRTSGCVFGYDADWCSRIVSCSRVIHRREPGSAQQATLQGFRLSGTASMTCVCGAPVLERVHYMFRGEVSTPNSAEVMNRRIDEVYCSEQVLHYSAEIQRSFQRALS